VRSLCIHEHACLCLCVDFCMYVFMHAFIYNDMCVLYALHERACLCLCVDFCMHVLMHAFIYDDDMCVLYIYGFHEQQMRHYRLYYKLILGACMSVYVC
jgi:hypothetical protein